MKKRNVVEPPASKSRWGLWLSIAVLGALAIWVTTRSLGRRIPEAGEEEEARRGSAGGRGRRDAPPTPARTTANAPTATTRPSATPLDDDAPAREANFDPSKPIVMTREQWIEDRRRLRETYLEKAQYPGESRPLAHKTDLLLPNHVEPMQRPLKYHDVDAGEQAGKVSIQQNQDRIFLKPGDTAVAKLQAFVDGKAVGIDSIEASFHRVEERRETAQLASATFLDDGVAPDEAAGDLTYTARVTLTAEALAGYTGPVALVARTRVQGEEGKIDFRFIASAPPPARFTGAIREVIEQGSLVFYVGVDVTTAGKYIGQARLYDANERPIAFLAYNVDLPKGPAEVRLLAYGKLLRDEGAAMPLVLRDIEGWRVLIGVYPDREVMAILDPRFRTKTYPLETFTDKPYDGPDKQKMLKSIDDATQSGMPPASPAPSASGPLFGSVGPWYERPSLHDPFSVSSSEAPT